MRRGPDDIEWQKCKKEVARRDGGVCCFCKTMTPKERSLFFQSFGKADVPYHMSQLLDPAHRLTAGTNPDIMYDPDNVFQLCRVHHDRLDTYRDPITDEYINKEKHDEYWERIANTRKKPEGCELPEFFI